MDNKKVGIGLGILATIVIVVVILLSLFKTPMMYTVTFDLGNNLISETKEVEKNGFVSKPTDPEKDGYTFEGWYYNGVLFDFSTEITNDIKLEAKWSSTSTQKWTVSFDPNGGSTVSDVEVMDGNAIAAEPKPTRTGYTFLGWYLDDKLFDFDTTITKNMTLTAKWEKQSTQDSGNEVVKPEKPVTVTYTVSFDSNSGSTVKSQTVTKNSTVKEPTEPTRDGYTFLGWYNGTRKFDFSTKITSNITLTAKWEKEVEEVVVSYKIVDVQNSTVPQAKLYILAGKDVVRGTIDVTSSSGKTRTEIVEVTGLNIVKGMYTYSNPKVLD